MTETVITSFSAAGYRLYGERFLESFDRFWPQSVRLVVYVEQDQPKLPALRRELITLPLMVVPGWAEFQAQIALDPQRRGRTPNAPGGYHIDFDARMARKTYMQAHAVTAFAPERLDKVFWLDADTVTHAEVPETLLGELLPAKTFCCFLARPQMYTETGFLGFAPAHPIAKDFFREYVDVFASGRIFTDFKQWHDCIAFDAARVKFDVRAFNNIAPGGPAAHVFINSRLGAYMDHLKGDGRKRAGRSYAKDLAAARSEPYWQGAR